MNKIKAGFFAIPELAEDADHVEYNHWHSTDHIPENLAIPGIVLGTRWAAPKSYIAARGETIAKLRPNQYVVHYLMTEPVERTIDEFRDLGQRTRALGRYFAQRTILGAGWFRLLKTFSAPGLDISAEALPFRPCRGVYLEMAVIPQGKESKQISRWYDEVHIPQILGVKGVLGAYWYYDGSLYGGATAMEDAQDMHVWTYYLGEDPLHVTNSIREAVGKNNDKLPTVRAILSGPYEAIGYPLHYDWHKR